MINRIECNGLVFCNIPLDAQKATEMGIPADIFEAELQRIKWKTLRTERDDLIAKTDWTQMPDVPLDEAKQAEFATYRQTLRDIPQTYDDPDAVVWPDKPTI